ncbi:hypothetical protein [Filifactor alocis]
MPSQNKTKNLKLNQWQENEYPKMIDFNNDNKKIDDAFGKVEQKVTEGVENLDIAGKQIEFVEAATRILPQTGDSIKTIVAKITKYLKDLKTVAFTGKYTDLTSIPASFPPAEHNHDDRYLGKLAKAESAKRADVATTAEQVQGFQFRKQNGKLEVLVEGEWVRVGSRPYTVNRKIDVNKTNRIFSYNGGPGCIRAITCEFAPVCTKFNIDGVSMLNKEKRAMEFLSNNSNQRWGVLGAGIYFNNSVEIELESTFAGYVKGLIQTEK